MKYFLILALILLPVIELAAQHTDPRGRAIKRDRPTLQPQGTTAKVLPADRDKKLRHDLLERVDQSSIVLREFMDAPDHSMPLSILDRATCVAVVPSMKKGGFGFGGQWGRGVISCRNEYKGWSPPSFFMLSGGSFGLQIGFQVVDLVMIITTRSGVNALLRNKVEIGADASATGLLVGRTAGVSTDPLFNARVVSYARSQGLFAGLELKGAWLKLDNNANRVLYGDEIHTHDILASERLGALPPTSSLYAFSRVLKDISPAKAKYVKVRKVDKPPSPPGQPSQ